MAAEVSCPPLPEGAVLLHVGLHKTGTTAMQTLLAANRPLLLEHGVVYPGDREEHHGLARAFTQRSFGRPGSIRQPPPPEVWSEFVAGLAQETRRVVISSEYLSVLADDAVARIVHDLGPERLHVLIGIRSLAASAASTWQQSLKDGRTLTIDAWAKRAIPRGGAPVKNPWTWDHAQLGVLAHQWANVAGADRVTMVVVEGPDRTRLPGTFEQLLDLPAGLLSSKTPPTVNRGMTAAEAEFVRRVNVASKDDIDYGAHRRYIRFGAILSMVERRTPAPDEPRPVLPEWAAEELRAAAPGVAEQIRASGVRVVGDLDALGATPAAAGQGAAPVDTVPSDAAVQALVGAVRVAARAAADARPKKTAPPPIAAVPAGALARELRRRVRRRAAALISRRGRRAT